MFTFESKERSIMTFEQCVLHCAANQDLLAEFARLTGHDLRQQARSPIVRMVDEATGYDRAAAAAFTDFVLETVWMPLTVEDAQP